MFYQRFVLHADVSGTKNLRLFVLVQCTTRRLIAPSIEWLGHVLEDRRRRIRFPADEMFALAVLHADRTVCCSNGTNGSFPEGTLPVSDPDRLCLSNAVG